MHNTQYPGKSMGFKPGILLLFWGLLTAVAAFPQQDYTIVKDSVIISAGKQYQKSGFHQLLWGRHYREDWAAPVMIKQLDLDTINGGLKPYQLGGSRQTKSLRLRNPEGREYVLRSIDKSYTNALPEIYRGTFLETIMNDQVSMAQPYAAITIPAMAEAAGIYHTKPEIVFIPVQPALGEYSKEMANKLYLLEQRPDENWEDAPNFGNSKNIIGTEKLLEKIFEESDRRVDQQAYVRARLFDIFIGDWGRHEDQWRWAEVDENGKKWYKPIPRDRDQVYTKLDGFLLSVGISAAGAGHLESFNPTIRNIAEYNFPARHLDRQFANETTLDDWKRIAKELKSALTDEVILLGVKNLPPAIFANSGEEIINNLTQRRNDLEKYAEAYYLSLAKNVEVTGTKEAEFFEIRRSTGGKVHVSIYDLNKDGHPKKDPFYSRSFNEQETEEIRLYGIGANDQFLVNDDAASRIRIRLIGGHGKNMYRASLKSKNVFIHDDANNDFGSSPSARIKISKDPYVHLYKYDAFRYDSKGIRPSLYYTSQDHFYTGLKYTIEKQQWRKSPYGYEQSLGLRYSLTERNFSAEYKGNFIRMIGKWDLVLNGGYDLMRWNNFFGIGNESRMLTPDRDFHRVRSKEGWGSMGLRRTINDQHTVTLSGQYLTVKIINDPDRFLKSHFSPGYDPDRLHYGIASLDYQFQNLDDLMLPSKGMKFQAKASFSQNLKEADRQVTQYSGMLNVFLPIMRSLVLSLKAGGATLDGEPEFYQLNRIGGGRTLRGYRKYRFYGESMVYNQNELQFIQNVKTFLFNGKAGLMAFYDLGRVWQPGENSRTWHTGYGGGIIFAPFNKLAVVAGIGFSREGRDFNIRVSKSISH